MRLAETDLFKGRMGNGIKTFSFTDPKNMYLLFDNGQTSTVGTHAKVISAIVSNGAVGRSPSCFEAMVAQRTAQYIMATGLRLS
jgi:hypothetical protein